MEVLVNLKMNRTAVYNLQETEQWCMDFSSHFVEVISNKTDRGKNPVIRRNLFIGIVLTRLLNLQKPTFKIIAEFDTIRTF